MLYDNGSITRQVGAAETDKGKAAQFDEMVKAKEMNDIANASKQDAMLSMKPAIESLLQHKSALEDVLLRNNGLSAQGLRNS